MIRHYREGVWVSVEEQTPPGDRLVLLWRTKPQDGTHITPAWISQWKKGQKDLEDFTHWMDPGDPWGAGVKVQADYPTKRAAARRLIQQAVEAMAGTTVETWRLEADLMVAFQRNVPHAEPVQEEEAK